MHIKETAEFRRWLDGLKDRRARVRIVMRIRRLAQGNPGTHRWLSSDISELKISVGKGYRVYYTIRDDVLVVLLCGGDKSAKAQQSADIAKAQRLAVQTGDFYDD